MTTREEAYLNVLRDLENQYPDASSELVQAAARVHVDFFGTVPFKDHRQNVVDFFEAARSVRRGRVA